jgi:FlaA1/EpsC-like NDP-sugar epimerase
LNLNCHTLVIKKNIGNLKRLLAFSHDVIAVGLAWWLAYALRFNFNIPSEHLSVMNYCLSGIVVIQGIGFYLFGLYRGIWRFASLVDLQRIVTSVVLTTTFITAAFFMLRSTFVVPRSVFIIHPALLILIMGGSRFIYRAIKENQLYGLRASQGEPVIIIGAGATAISLAKELSQGNQWRVVGFLDDDQSLHTREVSGIRVLGGISGLTKAHQKFGFSNMIIASPDLDHAVRRTILDLASMMNIDVLTVPAVDDLISGRFTVSQIRPVDVEDLLGRDVVNLDDFGLQQLIENNSVLVSGAGGSIGSELCRQILKFKPALLVCLDISEYSLYHLEQILSESKSETNLIFVVGDVKNEVRLDKLFKEYKPRLVFHAAAYKHVPLMENKNVSEAFQNNVIGTYTIARIAKKAKVDKFVLISTDKAVNPTSVMGATKRLAEMVCQGMQSRAGTRFVMVRFGNVLGSSGSVIPKFREQIKAGGPVTVTHPEITRYFMSIPEAAQLVMQAGLMSNGGEVFILDMGQPVRILDLARDMIKLSGFSEQEIKIEFSGLRPGEKLFEELLADDEVTLLTPHEKIRIGIVKPVARAWVENLIAWIQTTEGKEESKIKEEIKFWVEEYCNEAN